MQQLPSTWGILSLRTWCHQVVMDLLFFHALLRVKELFLKLITIRPAFVLLKLYSFSIIVIEYVYFLIMHSAFIPHKFCLSFFFFLHRSFVYTRCTSVFGTLLHHLVLESLELLIYKYCFVLLFIMFWLLLTLSYSSSHTMGHSWVLGPRVTKFFKSRWYVGHLTILRSLTSYFSCISSFKI